jgi:hypothetical protein
VESRALIDNQIDYVAEVIILWIGDRINENKGYPEGGPEKKVSNYAQFGNVYFVKCQRKPEGSDLCRFIFCSGHIID